MQKAMPLLAGDGLMLPFCSGLVLRKRLKAVSSHRIPKDYFVAEAAAGAGVAVPAGAAVSAGAAGAGGT